MVCAMIKIGELAKICGVNIQTLRYYDKIGLLCADMIDDSTGYRYYQPEKIQVFGTITALKQLGFSLDEIRRFLSASFEQRCRMYQNKKMELLEVIRNSQELIGKIDEACGNKERGAIPASRQMLDISFEDDPDVIGRWDYCGNMAARAKFDGEELLEKRDCLPEQLFFLPGGSPVWMYFWTRGTVYCLLENHNVILPHTYRIFTHDSVKYMAVDWIADRFEGPDNDDSIRVYRQTDTRAYSEKETLLYRDRIDLPYIPDDRVLGEWETVDAIYEKSAFSLRRIKLNEEQRTPMWLMGMTFYPREMCSKTIRRNSGVADIYLRYTSGAVIEEKREIAETYEIISTHGSDYLIIEHKSGDYSYTGEVSLYYVLRRKPE